MKITEIREEEEVLDDNLTEEEKEIWKTFEETGTLDGWKKESIDISGNSDDEDVNVENLKKFEGKSLTIKNCHNLTNIEANSLNLISLIIDNCSNLEELSAYNNELENFTLSGFNQLKKVDVNYNQLKIFEIKKCPNLEQLYCSNNELEELILDDNYKKLWILNCAYNSIKKLEVKHLENLRKLFCENNNLIALDVGDLKKLEELNCSYNIIFFEDEEQTFRYETSSKEVKIIEGITKHYGLIHLNVLGCDSLWFLDCAENSLEGLRLNNLRSLKILSCKSNNLVWLEINDCPKLEELDFSMQGIMIWIKGDECPSMLEDNSFTKLFINSYDNLKVINHATNFAIFDIEGNKQLTFKDFPALISFGSGTADDPSFEEWVDKKRAEQEAEEQRKLREVNPLPTEEEQKKKNNEEIPLCPWVLPTPKKGVKKIDLPHKHLIGKLIITDYPDLTFINVGNNELEALVVRNCPKLKRLIYAHNNLRDPEAEISGCGSLRPENIYNNQCQGGWERSDLTEDEKKKWEEQLDSEWEQQEESESRQEEQDFARLVQLIEQINQYLAKNDLAQADKALTELKELAQQPNSLIKYDKLQAKITDLERRLTQQKQLITSATSNYLPLIIISLILLGLLFLFINKQLIKVKQIIKSYENKLREC